MTKPVIDVRPGIVAGSDRVRLDIDGHVWFLETAEAYTFAETLVLAADEVRAVTP